MAWVVDVVLVKCSEGENTLVEGTVDQGWGCVVMGRCGHPVDLGREERYRDRRRLDERERTYG